MMHEWVIESGELGEGVAQSSVHQSRAGLALFRKKGVCRATIQVDPL